MKHTPENRRLLATLLAQGVSLPDAARQTGVSRPTAWRWKKDPEFIAMIQAASDKTLGDIVDAFRQRVQASVLRASARTAARLAPVESDDPEHPDHKPATAEEKDRLALGILGKPHLLSFGITPEAGQTPGTPPILNITVNRVESPHPGEDS